MRRGYGAPSTRRGICRDACCAIMAPSCAQLVVALVVLVDCFCLRCVAAACSLGFALQRPSSCKARLVRASVGAHLTPHHPTSQFDGHGQL